MNIKRYIKRCFLLFGYLFHRNSLSKIIFYHDVGLLYTDMGTPLHMIDRHIEEIVKQHFRVVNCISETNNQIMICFDDGWKGIYEAKEYFIRKKIFPTVFIAVELIGSEGHLTIEQILELKNSGFLFQAHSWSHNDLTKYNREGLKHELVDSKKYLEEILGEEIDSLCFPEGRFSNGVIEEAKRAGYLKLFSSISGAYHDRLADGYICRNLVQDLSSKEVKYVIKGHSSLMYKRNFEQHFQK